MEKFKGFPAKMQFTPLPNVFFSSLLPQIGDIAELKTTLHILGALYRKRGYPRFVPYSQLLANRSLMSSLSGLPPDFVYLVWARLRARSPLQLIPRAPPGMRTSRLLCIVARGIAPHHHRRRVPQQELHIYLSRLTLYRPGSEGVAELVGMHMRDPRPLRQPP